jgi:Thioesterase-like superfamily
MRPIVPSVAMTDPDAFYLPLGDGRYEPTRATESPWDSDAQHGGPPAALLAQLIDETVGDGLRLARLSIDFLGAIPRRELAVTVEPVKPGRRVSLSQARMTVAERTVAVARTWHIATGPRPPVDDVATQAPALPGEQEQREFFGLTGWGYGEAIEWRFTEGAFDDLGPAGVWTRVRRPLIAGEPITPLARTLVAADSANGLSSTLPIADWWSIPPGMTTTLMRPPAGEWVHLSCHTRLAGDGIGIAHADLHDEHGFLGEVAQPLLIARR